MWKLFSRYRPRRKLNDLLWGNKSVRVEVRGQARASWDSIRGNNGRTPRRVSTHNDRVSVC